LLERARQGEIQTFWDKIQHSDDLNDNLQDLVDYIKKFTNVESVYVGRLVQPKKDIADDDDEQAHQDEESQKIIQFLHDSEGKDFMKDKTLLIEEGKGITHDVFKEGS